VIRTCSAVITVCLVVLPGTAVAQIRADEPIKTTLCELVKDPARFAGQYVQVRATFVGNFEMSILVDDSCPRSNVEIWYGRGLVTTDTSEYAFVESFDAALKKPDDVRWLPSSPVTFHATKDSARMYRYVRKQQTHFGYAKVNATFTGRFDYISKWLALKAPNGEVTIVSAFGHQLCCSARLEPESVTEAVFPKK